MATDERDALLAEGQAALMLAESMLLLLVEAGTVEKQEVIEAIETVIATKQSMVVDGKAPAVSAAAVGLLSAIANSVTAVAGGAGAETAQERPPSRVPRSR